MMYCKQIKYVLLVCICWFHGSFGGPAPSASPTHFQLSNGTAVVGTGRGFQGTGRVFPSMFGGVFGSFLPFNINVPDVFSGMYSLVNNYFSSDSNPRPYSSRRKKHRTLIPTTTTTTTTTTPEPEEDEDEEDEDVSREVSMEKVTQQESVQAVEDLTQEESKRLTNEDLQELYQQFLRKKDEFDKLTKKKKKKRKHKHDDMLAKIASHLAYMELEC